MKIYLDTNIFVYLENGSFSLAQLEDSIGSHIDQIFFSASHIHETIEIRGKNEKDRHKRINFRLNTIEKITANNS